MDIIALLLALAINALTYLGLVQPAHGHWICQGDQGCHQVAD